ncbi:carnitine O-acetyltransferase [Maudiozyma humilis]|uniref:Carnitine O-acetyltransferase, mitochondrial n=1 Tax=Maudiozyma humilis TaxID=51915 RepID=A0AAV5RSI6_MAUHU|nr:carnitine O-acetyltransferase [Kazachstania humilis]
MQRAASARQLHRLLARSMSSATKSPAPLQRFAMASGNGEHYWAAADNAAHQAARPGFQGKTFSLQAELPSLPVPKLKDTVARYLESVKPYTHGDPAAYARQEQLCRDLLEGKGPELQQRLEQYARGKRNWMSRFWDSQAYLEYNDPVVPYVSYFFAHKALPATHARVQQDPLLKATAIVSAATRFIEALKDESLPAEQVRGTTPFCMNSFQLMFNTARLPGNPADNADTNVFYSLYENDYIAVAYRGNFYTLRTHCAKSGKPFAPGQIHAQFARIVHVLDGNGNAESHGVGALTSLPRDQWREAYVQLVRDPLSAASLEKIHRAAYLVCLDLDARPVTLEEKSHAAWHGDGVNRFFDKSVQFFVAGNGNSGFLGEHSKMDGTPTLFLNNYICGEMLKMDPQQFVEDAGKPCTKAEKHVSALQFNVSPALQNTIESAQLQMQETIGQHALKVWHYNRYGKEFIKSHKMSPDAYLQQIVQLAVYKYLGRQLPTYEAASTRKFFKGRTETGRSVSEASRRFVEAWGSPDVSRADKVQLLRDSAAAHAAYLKAASDGLGVDRHFFGLKNMVNPEQDKETIPALFSDPLFNYSSTWLVSTSQLTSEHFDGYGWSQVNDLGFGLAYMLNKQWLHINIVNKPELSGLSGERLHHYLNEAADEMAEALIAESTKAKL